MTWLSAIAYGIGAGLAFVGLLLVIEIIDAWRARRRDIKARLDPLKAPPPAPTAKIVRIDRRRRP